MQHSEADHRWINRLIMFALLLFMFFIVLTQSQDVFGAVGYPAISVTSPVTKSVASQLVCAILCKLSNCQVFSYQDGTCSMDGLGQVSHNGSAVYMNLDATSRSTIALPDNLPAIASSEHIDGLHGPEKALDGKLNTWFCLGKQDDHPWWRVDLLMPYFVHELDIFPRNASNDAEGFQKIEIRVGMTDAADGNFDAWGLFATYEGPYQPNSDRLVFTSAAGIFGQYIGIKRELHVNKLLKLIDVKIYVRSL